jgi:hypothetical protein
MKAAAAIFGFVAAYVVSDVLTSSRDRAVERERERVMREAFKKR